MSTYSRRVRVPRVLDLQSVESKTLNFASISYILQRYTFYAHHMRFYIYIFLYDIVYIEDDSRPLYSMSAPPEVREDRRQGLRAAELQDVLLFRELRLRHASSEADERAARGLVGA